MLWKVFFVLLFILMALTGLWDLVAPSAPEYLRTVEAAGAAVTIATIVAFALALLRSIYRRVVK